MYVPIKIMKAIIEGLPIALSRKYLFELRKSVTIKKCNINIAECKENCELD